MNILIFAADLNLMDLDFHSTKLPGLQEMLFTVELCDNQAQPQ
jgi:hypothetical protein